MIGKEQLWVVSVKRPNEAGAMIEVVVGKNGRCELWSHGATTFDTVLASIALDWALILSTAKVPTT